MSAKGDVGSRKIFEDDDVIVWEFELGPGETTPCHTHEHDYVWYVLEGTPLEVFDANDQPLGTIDAYTGATFALRLEGNDLVPALRALCVAGARRPLSSADTRSLPSSRSAKVAPV